MNSTAPRLNSKNIKLDEKFILNIFKKFNMKGIKVNDLSLYQRAFIHRSYLKSDDTNTNPNSNSFPLQNECNERLELLGDSILSSVVVAYLFDRYPDSNEGFITNLKMNIVRGKTLGTLSKKLGLDKYIVISEQVEEANGRNNPRILEDLFEAFIGAMYLDNGATLIPKNWTENITRIKDEYNFLREIEADNVDHVDQNQLCKYLNLMNETINQSYFGHLICQRFIINVIENHINISRLINHDSNYKNRLLRYFQRTWRSNPTWDLLERDSSKNYVIGVNNIDGELIGVGVSRKKQEAEQKASKRALSHLLAKTSETTDLDISDSDSD